MKCELCGKEFDWPGHRFCSKECRCKFNGRQCNKNGKLTGHPNYNKNYKPKENGWDCPFCDKNFRTYAELKNHKKIEHAEIFNRGCAWAKGLTKDTCKSVAKFAKTISENYKNGVSGHYDHQKIWTDEKRKRQSEIKKQLYALHPEKHPNFKLANNKNKMTYPEQLAFDFLVEKGFNPNHNKHLKTATFNRYVDFYIEEFKLIIEIDGEYWHKDKDKDIRKDEEAKDLGYTTLRIIPKNRSNFTIRKFF